MCGNEHRISAGAGREIARATTDLQPLRNQREPKWQTPAPSSSKGATPTIDPAVRRGKTIAASPATIGDPLRCSHALPSRAAGSTIF
jgi:hypothetical protein